VVQQGRCGKCDGRYLPESKGRYVCANCGFRPVEMGPVPKHHNVFGAPDLRKHVTTSSKTNLGMRNCSLIFQVKGGRIKTFVRGLVQVKIQWLCEENTRNNRYQETNYPLTIEVVSTMPSSFHFDWNLYPAEKIANAINESFRHKTGANLDYLIAWIKDEQEHNDNFATKISRGR